MFLLTILFSLLVLSTMPFAIWQDDEEDEDDNETYDKWYSERKTLGSKFTKK